MIRNKRLSRLAFVTAVAATLVACDKDRDEPDAGNLVLASGKPTPIEVCWSTPSTSEFIIGVVSLKNDGDEALTITGVELIGEGELAVLEGATIVIPEGRPRIGAVHYAGESKTPEWKGRDPIPAIIDPGETVDFVYHAKATPTAYIDRAELTYEDESGQEYFFADHPVSVAIDKPNTGCDTPEDEAWDGINSGDNENN